MHTHREKCPREPRLVATHKVMKRAWCIGKRHGENAGHDYGPIQELGLGFKRACKEAAGILHDLSEWSKTGYQNQRLSHAKDHTERGPQPGKSRRY